MTLSQCLHVVRDAVSCDVTENMRVKTKKISIAQDCHQIHDKQRWCYTPLDINMTS